MKKEINSSTNKKVSVSNARFLSYIDDKDFFENQLKMISDSTKCAIAIGSTFENYKYKINFTRFCENIVNNSKPGKKACKDCFTQYCKKAIETKKTQTCKCDAGIYKSIIPFFDEETYLGSVLFGQVMFKKPDLEFCKQKAKEYGLSEKTYIKYINQIPVIKKKDYNRAIVHIEKTVKTLLNLKIAKNTTYEYELKRDFILEILNIINEKKDLNEILFSLVAKIAALFNVDRIKIIDITGHSFNIETDYIVPDKIDNETAKALREAEKSKDIAKASKKALLNLDLVIINDIKSCPVEQKLVKLYESFGLKSGISTTFDTGNRKKAIILESFSNYHSWTNKDRRYLDLIIKGITTALNQASMLKDIENQLYVERTLLNNIPCEIGMKDANRKYVAVNRVWLKQYKKKLKDVIGKSGEEILPKELAEKLEQIDDYIFIQKKPCREEFLFEQDGKMVWKEINISPVIDKNGKVIGSTSFKMDITDEKEVERMKSEFVSMVSHELRTPLTSIISGLTLALSGKLGDVPEKIKTVLDIAQRNSNSLLSVINDLLDIEKLTAGKMNYYFEILEIYKIIDETIKDITGFAENHNIKVVYNQDLRKKLYIKADKMRFAQVITNLLSNAIKFTENNRDVEILVRNLSDNKIRIFVINYGNEIPKEFRNKIFGKFVQADSSESRRKSGAGLGLSIVRQIVKDMNGKIDFTSKNGKTVFYVDFNKITP